MVGFNLQPIFQNGLNSREEDISNPTPKKLLTKEYLRSFPNEQYIIDSGDALQITISRDYPELTSNVIIDGEGKINLPIIISGGAGNGRHLVEGLKQNRVDAVSSSHLFNFIGDGLKRARQEAKNSKIKLANW